MGFTRIPLDLPHAGKVSFRIALQLEERVDWLSPDAKALRDGLRELQELLHPIHEQGENPPGPEALRVRDEAARLGRAVTTEIVRLELGADRLGQCVRNLFECLELGQEGADLGLQAGEDPRSLQRP